MRKKLSVGAVFSVAAILREREKPLSAKARVFADQTPSLALWFTQGFYDSRLLGEELGVNVQSSLQALSSVETVDNIILMGSFSDMSAVKDVSRVRAMWVPKDGDWSQCAAQESVWERPGDVLSMQRERFALAPVIENDDLTYVSLQFEGASIHDFSFRPVDRQIFSVNRPYPAWEKSHGVDGAIPRGRLHELRVL